MKQHIWILIALALTGAVMGTAAAQDAASLEAFFDGALNLSLTRNNIAGAAAVVVQDGETVFSKGYGYADLERGLLVDPARTLFRVGSVSKLFTWTAVMQLVDQGLIDLDRDIGEYLDIEIPRAYPDPITMRHLMTHTPGFEDRVFELWRHGEEDMESLDTWLATHAPAQVRPPGTYAAYSNYGVTLAGLIIERVSGLGYNEYIEENIFSPLGMTRSSARQPLPESIAGDLATAYARGAGGFAAQDFEWINVGPAGSVSASPEDIARFMIAHLDRENILTPEAFDLMHSRGFGPDERTNGMAHGFFEMDAWGERAIGHGGDTLFYHSVLVLWPERRLGVFITCNSMEGAGTPNAIAAEFARYLFADGRTAGGGYAGGGSADGGSAGSAERAAHVAGTYGTNRLSYTTGERMMRLFSAIRVTALEDGSIMASSDGERFVEVQPYLYRHERTGQYLYFETDESGRATHAHTAGSPAALERLAAADLPATNAAVLGLAALLFLGILIGRPVAALARRRCTPRVRAVPEKRLRNTYLGLAAVGVLLIGNVVAITTAGNLGFLLGDIPGRRLLYATVPLLSLATALSGIMIALAWGRKTGRLMLRVRYSITTLSAIGLLWFVAHWNLLTW